MSKKIIIRYVPKTQPFNQIANRNYQQRFKKPKPKAKKPTGFSLRANGNMPQSIKY